jgi:hypothetical protein
MKNIDSPTSVNEIVNSLSNSENGSIAMALATKLGLWSVDSHRPSVARESYPAEISSLSHSQISDLYSRWTSEFGRITELCGAISGQETLLKIKIKTAQAKARSVIRNRYNQSTKPLSSTALSDLVDEDPNVIELYEQGTLLQLISAHANAAKEATSQYLSSISREISFRDVQLKAKIY